MDDVVLWKRALASDEITSVFQNGTPVPFSKPQPLAIRSFTADLPAVAVGDTVTLRWDVTKSVQVEIDQGVGDVTSKTVSGLGTTEVTIPASRNFTLTLRRGSETVSESVSVGAIGEVADGWTLIENFDRYSAGPLSGQGGWFDLDGADFSVVLVGENRLVAPHGGDAAAVLPLGPLTVGEGQERTLFFRLYLVGDEFEPVRGQVALTDRPLRFGNEVGNNVGPGALISDESGVRALGGYNGWQSVSEFGPEPILEPQAAYNVWVNIKNGPFERDTSVDPPVNLGTGDTYSIFAAKDGSSQRLPVITDYAASRDPVGQADLGFTRPLLDKVVVGGIAGHSAVTNLFIDDIYLSKSGFNDSVPRAFGFTTPVTGPQTGSTLNIVMSAGQLEISWSAGVLESTASLTEAWAPVAGAANPPYRTNPEGTQRFYRARQ
jgi:hypothetical protein